MKRLAAMVLVAGALAGCASRTTTTTYPSASPPVYTTQATCVAAGGVWDASTATCAFAGPERPQSGTQRTGPSGTPGERPPGY